MPKQIQPPAPPFIPARWSGGAQGPRMIVMHGTVSPCVKGGARTIAQYFATTERKASAHYTVDPGEIIQSVGDHTVAYHCGHNQDSIGVELCDPQIGDPARWGDVNHTVMLARAAKLVARLCLAYGIPVVRVSVADLKAGKHGICGHADMSLAFRQSTHVDPGTAFPWTDFMKAVKTEARALQEPKPTVAFELIATLNALGAHLTPGKLHPTMDSGEVRMTAAKRALNKAGVTVCALQEFETPQADVIEASKRWALIRATPNNTYRNGNTGGNALMFRKDIWRCLEARDLPVAISGKRILHLSLVYLQHIKTADTVVFVVVHAPSKGPISGGTDADRSRVKAAAVASGAQVILGDFNERTVTLPGYTIQAHSGPDWIFTHGLVADEPAVLPFKAAGISDHNAVAVRLTLTA
jgi:N-acetyl-anhydromuramyl-L-alanine amidase AmpD